MIVISHIPNNSLSSHEVKTYISIKSASINFGYCSQYLRRLLRENRLEGIKIGQMWFIHINSLSDYIDTSRSFNDLRFGPRQ